MQQNYRVFDEGQGDVFQQGTLLARAEICAGDEEELISIPPIKQHPKDVIELQIAPKRG
jgi:hypothetical protein